MITIGHVKGLKKMLHVTSLKLFSLKEVPLNSKESRKNLKVFIYNVFICRIGYHFGKMNFKKVVIIYKYLLRFGINLKDV